MNIKEIYNKDKDYFYYKNIDNNKLSFCYKCGSPVISIENPNCKYILAVCVDNCFKIKLNKSVFDKYTMDNIVDLYKNNYIH